MVEPCSFTNLRIDDGEFAPESGSVTPMMTRSLECFFCSSVNRGTLILQGGHQTAQNSTTWIFFPLSLAKSTAEPFTHSAMASGGALSPTASPPRAETGMAAITAN